MRRFILYIFTTALLSSCNDHLKIEKNNDPQGYADSQFVGTWKITGVSCSIPWDWDGNGTVESNIYAVWSPCQKDNLFTFVGDKTGTFKLNCNTASDGTWQVITTKHLVYTLPGITTESEKVVSMTSIQFSTTIDITLPNSQPAVITRIWTRK